MDIKNKERRKRVNKLFKEMQELVFKDTDEDLFLTFCKDNEEMLLNEDPITYMSQKIDFYLQRENADGALNVIEQFKKGKYISMECEEFLDDVKTKILETVQHNQNREKSKEEIISYLLSNKREKVIYAIQELSVRNLRLFIAPIEEFLKKNKDEDLSRLLLIILVEQKVDHEFIFTFKRKKKAINPYYQILPTDDKNYKEMMEFIGNQYRLSPQETTFIQDMMMQIMVTIYPDNIFQEFDMYQLYDYLRLLYKMTTKKGERIKFKNKKEMENFLKFYKLIDVSKQS